ncbi:Transient-receptor-potential-like protein like [Argiope bruennichi]|uniref:Transient-receptor-potential-like protein like n=1 Tax=Argiope bruennichi TaxID=94029 RepID=A0A8T0F356_ARGBR|nr:Transient-receptor-potential-like protein like [Argiope bruennichi]
MAESERLLLDDNKNSMSKSSANMDSHSLPYHRMSFVDDILSPTEKKFLKLVEQGDIDGLKNLLKTKKQLNLDCCDYKGRRALDISIKRRDITMFEFLLHELKISNLHYYCAMLSAVLENDVYILEILFNRIEETENVKQCLQCLVGGGPECLRYLPEVASSNLTPLMVAALEGNIEITKMFLERGYLVKKPHSPNCICETCCTNRAKTGETLTESMSRINTYRTLASPTYLILTTCDPILAAFQLSYDLERLSCNLPEHQKEYKELSRKCSNFAADLLDECRTTEEVKTLLSQRLGCPDTRPEMLNRFVTAVHYGQKQFVTHPNCQQVLRSIWVEGLPWYSWTSRMRVLHVIKHSLLMPIICIAYAFAPNAKKLEALNIPINRFIYFTSSYCVFLLLLLMTLLCDRLFQTGNNLFWAIFGKGEPHFADIYNCQNKTNGEVSMDEIIIDENRHYFTEAVGYGMWGMYHFIACLVILNMLIGMMAESYQRVQENADMEWKFACSTLWLSVFDVSCLVPPPFNLLPSIQWFMTQYKWMKTVGKGEKYSAYLTPSEKKECYIKHEKERLEKKCEDEKYEKLMVQLIRRYLHSNGLKESAVTSTSGHRCCWKRQNDKKRSKSAKEDNPEQIN